jgi:hypothetical protein
MDWFDNVGKAMDQFGQGALKACNEFGEKAEKAFDAFGQEAKKVFCKFGHGFLKCLYLRRWEFLKLAIWIL